MLPNQMNQEIIDELFETHRKRASAYYTNPDLNMSKNNHCGYDFVNEAIPMLTESDTTRVLYFADVANRMSVYQDAVLDDLGNHPQDRILDTEARLLADQQKVISYLSSTRYPELTYRKLTEMGYTNAAEAYRSVVGLYCDV
tara:strand:+ start:81 stop:506 length:426 start_codon:yes stop_codon:yes gene_type:complete